LVTGACLAAIGHQVTCTDIDKTLVDGLKARRLPLYEPHLQAAVQHACGTGHLTFSSENLDTARSAEAIFLCVGVPQLENGDTDPSALDAAARQIATAVDPSKLVIVRGTVPLQTSAQLKHLLAVYGVHKESDVRVAANPQFLREGSAFEEFLHPDRILVGVGDSESEETLRQIYAPILEQAFPCPVHDGNCPSRRPPELLVTNLQSAELIKHASNAFLAVKISYANVIADLCEHLGGNVLEVTGAVGLDPRIGSRFLEAGIGFGGSRLPKDLRAFCGFSERAGVDAGILQAAGEVNRRRLDLFLEKVQRSLWVLMGKRIGLLGLAHKADTDDIRGSPAIELFKRFSEAGAQVRAYDPRAMARARSAFPAMVCGADVYDVAQQADALIVATDWPEFLILDWKRIRDLMARPTVFDGRNLLSPPQMKALGFEYHSVGRPDS